MTPKQMMALGTAFAAYLRRFQDCFLQARTREHLYAYCRGLLSDLPRKSIEPIALACGTAVCCNNAWRNNRRRTLPMTSARLA